MTIPSLIPTAAFYDADRSFADKLVGEPIENIAERVLPENSESERGVLVSKRFVRPFGIIGEVIEEHRFDFVFTQLAGLGRRVLPEQSQDQNQYGSN